jgi:hypothetical protein
LAGLLQTLAPAIASDEPQIMSSPDSMFILQGERKTTPVNIVASTEGAGAPRSCAKQELHLAMRENDSCG